jgi:hypothetical protein
MKAMLIHADGRPEILMGQQDDQLMSIAVLTQAALAAIDEAAKQAGQRPTDAIQLHHGETLVTVLRLSDSRLLRVEHETGVAVEQVREWSRQFTPPAAPKVIAPTQTSRVTSLADALNVGMP